MSSIAEENGGFFRKNAAAIAKYLEIAVQMISDISDDEAWEQGVFGDEEELSEDSGSPHVAGIVVRSGLEMGRRWWLTSRTRCTLRCTSLRRS